MGRRTFLWATGATVVGGALAGCSGTQRRRYESGPASLAPEAGELGLANESSGRIEFERRESVANNTLEVTLVNYGATYDGDPTGVGVGTTPVAEEAGQQLNPVVGASYRELLAGEVGQPLRQGSDIGVDASVEWTRGPEAVETTSGRLLGGAVDVKTFVGVTDDPEAVVVSLARRIHREDVVIVGNALSRGIENEPDRPLIDEDGGAFAPVELDEAIRLLLDVLPLVVRDPAAELLSGTTTTPTAGSGNLEGDVYDTDANRSNFQ